MGGRILAHPLIQQSARVPSGRLLFALGGAREAVKPWLGGRAGWQLAER